MKATPFIVYVSDVNGNRIETVTSRARNKGQPIYGFASESWAFQHECHPIKNDDVVQAFTLLKEAAELMPLGTAKRARWICAVSVLLHG